MTRPAGRAAMRFFNTAGPVVAADHYRIPPRRRFWRRRSG